MSEMERLAADYERIVLAVPPAAREFARETWGLTWAHAEMGSLWQFAVLATEQRIAELEAENARLRADIDAYEKTAQIIATLPPLLERVRHVKRGTEYEVLGEAEAQVAVGDALVFGNAEIQSLRDGDMLTVYRCLKTGKLWTRLTGEFRDGRFVPSGKADAPAASE